MHDAEASDEYVKHDQSVQELYQELAAAMGVDANDVCEEQLGFNVET